MGRIRRLIFSPNRKGKLHATPNDLRFMERALEEARRAADEGEVPVGAVVVLGADTPDARIIGVGRNRRETANDPTAHAEVLAIREAARTLGVWRLTGATLYVTLEPCAMCAGALVLARVDRLVFGARDAKAGAVGSLMNLAQDPRLNHRLEVTAGVLETPCSEELSRFFRQLRARKQQNEKACEKDYGELAELV